MKINGVQRSLNPFDFYCMDKNILQNIFFCVRCKSYRFGTTWEWTNDDRIFNFCMKTIPIKLVMYSSLIIDHLNTKHTFTTLHKIITLIYTAVTCHSYTFTMNQPCSWERKRKGTVTQRQIINSMHPTPLISLSVSCSPYRSLSLFSSLPACVYLRERESVGNPNPAVRI